MKESLGIKQMQREIINELSKLITCLIHQYLYASQIYPKHTFENKIYEGHVKVPISKSQILKKYIQNQVESLKDHFNVLSNLEIQQYEKEKLKEKLEIKMDIEILRIEEGFNEKDIKKELKAERKGEKTNVIRMKELQKKLIKKIFTPEWNEFRKKGARIIQSIQGNYEEDNRNQNIMEVDRRWQMTVNFDHKREVDRTTRSNHAIVNEQYRDKIEHQREFLSQWVEESEIKPLSSDQSLEIPIIDISSSLERTPSSDISHEELGEEKKEYTKIVPFGSIRHFSNSLKLMCQVSFFQEHDK